MEASRDIKPVDTALLVKGGYLAELRVLLNRFRYLIEGREARQGTDKFHEAREGFRSMLGKMKAEAYPFGSYFRKTTEQEKRLQHIIDTIDPRGVGLVQQLGIVIDWINKIEQIFFNKLHTLREELKTSSEDFKRAPLNDIVQARLKRLLSNMDADEEKFTKMLKRQSNELGQCYEIYQQFTIAEYGEFQRFASDVERYQKSLFEFIDDARSRLKKIAEKDLVLPQIIRRADAMDVNEKNHKESVVSYEKITGFMSRLQNILQQNGAALNAMAEFARACGEELDTLQLKYSSVASSYKTLHAQFVGYDLEINKNRQSLSVQIHEQLQTINGSVQSNEDKIVNQIKAYLDTENMPYQAAKSAVERLLKDRGQVEDGADVELLKLKAHVTQQQRNMGFLVGQLATLDDSCEANGLTLCSQSRNVLVNETARRDAKLLEQFNKKYTEPLQDRSVSLAAITTQCNAEQIELGAHQRTFGIDAAINDANISSLLNKTLRDGHARTVDDSEQYIIQQVHDLSLLHDQAAECVNQLQLLQTACLEKFDIIANANKFKKVIDVSAMRDRISDFRVRVNNYQVNFDRDKEKLKQLAVWDDYQQESAYIGLFDDVSLLQLNEREINESLKAILAQFNSLSRCIRGVDSLRKAAAESKVEAKSKSEAELEKERELEVLAQESLDRYCEIKATIDLISPLLAGLPRNMFQRLQEEINARPELSSIRSELIQDSHQQFVAKYKNLEWGRDIPVYPDNHIQDMNAWPGKLEDAMAKFSGFANALMGAPAKSGDLTISAELDAVHTAIAKKLAASKALQLDASGLIDAAQKYLKSYEAYRIKKHTFSVRLNDLSALAQRLDSMISLLLPLNQQLLACQNKAGGIIALSSQVKNHRNELKRYCRAFQEGINDDLKSLDRAMSNLDAEEKFKKGIFNILDSIKSLKEMKQSGFTRLRREFLFCGQSRRIIAKLQAHREIVHAHSNKGVLIETFLNNLFDENRFASIDELLAYLKTPFNDQRKDELFGNTGWSNLGGKGRLSTTKELVKELRAELKLMQAREQANSVNSVAYALEKDYDQIEGEVSGLLQSKNLVGVSRSLLLNQQYDGILQFICHKRSTDPVKSKIQQDAVYIQRWFGPLGAEVAVADRIKQRAVHLECAMVIRNQSQEEMGGLRRQYPFTYAYHALRCHLENTKTDRSDQKNKLWMLLDGIVFDKGTEVEKYQKLKNTVLGIYSEVRESFNGSESYFFFGKGSRLGDALEKFLIGNEDTGAGLGFKSGEDIRNHQVSHRRKVEGLDAAACWLRNNVFACARP